MQTGAAERSPGGGSRTFGLQPDSASSKMHVVQTFVQELYRKLSHKLAEKRTIDNWSETCYARHV